MNARTMALLVALALVVAGLAMIVAEFMRPPPAETRVPVAMSVAQIKPYTIITQDMIKSGTPLLAAEAHERGAYPVSAVVGLMSTDLILPGTLIAGVNAKPVEDVRFVSDFNLEIVSFAAGVDRTVGGKLRPGHIINLYGFGRDALTQAQFTELIEPRLWVVGVSAGGQPVSGATPRPDIQDGRYYEENAGADAPATLVTVAVTPQQAVHIIDALGADGLNAWVTLAANQTVELARATPVPAAPTTSPGTLATVQAIVDMRPTAVVKGAELGYGGMAGTR